MHLIGKMCFALIIVLTSLFHVQGQSIESTGFQERYEKGMLYVTASPEGVLKYDASEQLYSDSEVLNALINTFQIKSFEQIAPGLPEHENMYVMECDCDEDALLQVVSELTQYYTMPEKVRVPQLLFTPDDYTMEFSSDWALDLINAEEAWDLQTGDSNVVLAICDNGYELDHEELQGSYTYVHTPNTPMPHGTAVAIIAAGNTNNGAGKSSVGFNCSLALWKVTLGQVALASYHGARVVNMSWATGCTPSSYEQAQVNLARSFGAMLIASAGNGNMPCNTASCPVYPAAYNGVVAVSSVNSDDSHEATPGDSTSTHSHYPQVDLVAPGYNVPLAGQGNTYTTSSGTSVAAPFVTGAAGLIFSENPNFTNDEVEEILKCSADDIYTLNPSYVGLLGAGRLNVGEAVKMARNFTSPDIETGCDGTGSVSVTTLGSGNYTFEWSTGQTTTAGISGLSAGMYSVTIKHQCGFSRSFDFVIDTIPVVSAGMDQKICEGDSVTLSGSGTLNYSWDNGVIDGIPFTPGVGTVVYTVTGSASNGCTNSDQVNVTVNAMPDVGVVLDQDIFGSLALTVSESGAQYQWLNCDKNNAIIVGKTNQVFAVKSNGNYAVRVAKAGCVDTSACIPVTTVGIVETAIKGLTVAPNPTDGVITLSFGDVYNSIDVKVLDATGRVVQEVTGKNSSKLKLFLDHPSGFYTLRIESDAKQANVRVIVQ